MQTSSLENPPRSRPTALTIVDRQELVGPPPIVLREGLTPEEVERRLLSVHRESDAGQRTLAFYLAEMDCRRIYQFGGYTSAAQFAEARLDMAKRTARELIRAGKELRDLPILDESFCEGRLSWTKVRLLLRIVEAETEQGWVDLAEKLSVRELERRIVRSRKGDRADQQNSKAIGEVTFRVNAKVGALTLATLEKAREKASALLGEPITDDALLATLAGAFLSTRQPGEDQISGAVFHVSFTADSSGAVEVETQDGPVPLRPAAAEMVICDAGVARACHCKSPDPLPFGQDAPTPEGLRRRILARDGHRCLSCHSTVDLHVHHVRFRSAGGPTVASNLTTICVRCHTLVHEGLLCIRGTAPNGLSITDRRGQALERFEPGALRIARSGVAASADDHKSDLTYDQIPKEADQKWWRRHAHLFSWDHKRGALLLTPGQPLPEEAAQSANSSESGGPDLDALIGQTRVVRALKHAALGAERDNRAVAHTLLHGPAGCGKTTLARALGRTRGVRTHMAAGPTLTSTTILVGLLTGMEAHDLLFIDEIHALPRPVMETLYEVMEGQALSLQIAEGVRARTITLQLPAITIVGATTEPHLLPPALVSRFPLEETVELYSEEELVQIVTLAATKFDKTISLDGARILARASKGTPRIAKALLARARDVARACHLTAADARATLEAASLDARGLGPNHRRALDYLRDRALGTVRLAGLLGLTAKAFRTLIEPDLLRMRLVVPTAQGLVPAACCKT